MNKADLVEVVAANTATKKDAALIVDNILAEITKKLKKRDDVALSGFGTFRVKQTKARMGRNPKTGEAIKISAKKKVVFRAAKVLKEAVL